uniref:Uncharacterized protein n=1 Tax=Oryza glumipatula TaxID=40148 RepID=A0A0D9YSR6_9ORYZ
MGLAALASAACARAPPIPVATRLSMARRPVWTSAAATALTGLKPPRIEPGRLFVRFAKLEVKNVRFCGSGGNSVDRDRFCTFSKYK